MCKQKWFIHYTRKNLFSLKKIFVLISTIKTSEYIKATKLNRSVGK